MKVYLQALSAAIEFLFCGPRSVKPAGNVLNQKLPRHHQNYKTKPTHKHANKLYLWMFNYRNKNTHAFCHCVTDVIAAKIYHFNILILSVLSCIHNEQSTTMMWLWSPNQESFFFFFSSREASLPGRTAGQDGDVPLFHHFVAELSSSVPSRNCSHCDSQTRHDFAAQTLLHLRRPQAAEISLLCTAPQVAKQFCVASSVVQDRILLFCTAMQPHPVGA